MQRAGRRAARGPERSVGVEADSYRGRVTVESAIRKAVARPATDDEFDIEAALSAVLDGIGLGLRSAGGRISFAGADPIVPSTLRLGAAASIGLVAKSVAVAALLRDRRRPGQDISMDLRVAPHRLCPFYDQRWELLNGFAGGSPSNPTDAFGLRFYPTRDGRWVMPLNPYPRIKVAAQRLLGVPDDPDAVAAAIVRRDARELEDAGAEAGVVLPMLRTVEEFLDEPQFRDVLAAAPLVEIERIADSDPEPLLPGAADPLTGVRALGMGHVIAGAGTGRALALHGADVLNLWGPRSLEHDLAYQSANVGMRSSTVDVTTAEGREVVVRLLSEADVFFANRRPGVLDRVGLSAHAAAAIRPGVVHASVSLKGESGPWAGRVGFDQTAGCLTGMMLLEGGGDSPALPPILVVNDYLTAWLLTAGIVAALRRRSVEGGSYRVHVSLTRVALWILSLGVLDREYARDTAGRGDRHAYRDPETFRARTPLGLYQGVTDQVRMSRTPGQYRHVLVPRGSSAPTWLERDVRPDGGRG